MFEEEMMLVPSRIQHQQQVVNHYRINIVGEVLPPENYLEEIYLIENAGPQDVIDIFLETPGGSFATAIAFRTALFKTSGTSQAIIGTECSSSGTVIALSCDEVETTAFSSFMIHGALFGIPPGTQQEVRASHDHSQALLTTAMNEIYTGFLTIGEIEDCISNGRQLYFTGESLYDRLTRYYRGIGEDHESCDNLFVNNLLTQP